MQEIDLMQDEETLSLAYNKTQVKEYAKEDMDFFAALALPEVATLPFPNFYVWLWGILISVLFKARDFSKFAIGLPRGHAKTMVIKLLILYAIVFTKKRYILVIGANAKKAEAIIADVADMLSSDNIQRVFGNWRYACEKDTESLKKFNFNGRAVILEAAGQGTAIRGSNQKNSRPDVIVFDDAQTKECAESVTEAKKFQSWFIGTALKAKSPTGCTFIYIGNMYKDMEIVEKSGRYCCMLRNLQKMSGWTSIVVGGILEGFTALWEELHPLEQLLQEFKDDLEAGQAEVFYAEVLNDPKVSTSYFFDPNKVTQWNKEVDDIHQGNVIIIDPATSKATPDQVVIGYGEIYDNIPVAMDMAVDKFTGPQTVHKAIEMAMKHNCRLIVVESNAYQYSLCEWFNFVFEQTGLHGIQVMPIYSGRGNKNSRILKMFQSLMKGELKVNSEIFIKVLNQAIAFDPSRTDNVDDILDFLEMLTRSAVEFRHLMHIEGDLAVDFNLNQLGIQDQATQPSYSSF